MNYFVTHCDINFIDYAERLFKTLSENSNTKIIFYAIGFEYESKFDNVISFSFSFKETDDFRNLYGQHEKAKYVFLKPLILEDILKNKKEYFNQDDTFCYVDADCFCFRQDCDKIFDKKDKLTNFPLLQRFKADFMVLNNMGSPFSEEWGLSNEEARMELCLEANLLDALGYGYKTRKFRYSQTGVMLFDYNCLNFIEKWKEICYSDLVLNNIEKLTPFHEETVINCLLYQIPDEDFVDLGTVLTNIENNIEDCKKITDSIKAPKQNTLAIDEDTGLVLIPGEKEINNLFFFHGKCPEQCYDFLIDEMKENVNRKKIIFLTPHLSTGGAPAYLEWLIKQKIKDDYEIFVVEYLYYGDYVVHRNRIQNLVAKENFISLVALNESGVDEILLKKSISLIEWIKNLNPDEIFLNELAEDFALRPLTNVLIDFLFDSNRKFKIYETCHTSSFDFENIKYMPDEFHFCSIHHLQKATDLPIPCKLLDMYIPKKSNENQKENLIRLGLDPGKYHVLQVGLFHHNKNQKFTFDLASNFDNNVQFHFVGNTCFYDSLELEPLDNCVIWGERNDLDIFYSSMDLFVLPSLQELNPISIKEARSWDMPCFVSEIETLVNQYKNSKNIHFIKGNNLLEYIKENYEEKRLKTVEENNNLHNEIKYDLKYSDGSLVLSIPSEEEGEFQVDFFKPDPSEKELIYTANLVPGTWAAIEYVKNDVEILITRKSDGLVKFIGSHKIDSLLFWYRFGGNE